MNFFLDIRVSELILLPRVSSTNSYSSSTHQTNKRRISHEQTRTYRSNRSGEWIDESRGRKSIKFCYFEHYRRANKERQSHARWVWYILNFSACSEDRPQSKNRRIDPNCSDNSSEIQSRERIEASYQRILVSHNSSMKTADDFRPLFFYYI